MKSVMSRLCLRTKLKSQEGRALIFATSTGKRSQKLESSIRSRALGMHPCTSFWGAAPLTCDSSRRRATVVGLRHVYLHALFFLLLDSSPSPLLRAHDLPLLELPLCNRCERGLPARRSKEADGLA